MVSIIIPTYNHANALSELLQSISRQTCRDIEVIVVDDGSEDDPCAVVKEAKKNFPFPLTCVKQDNAGAPVARNNGAKLAKGDYYIFTDADLVFKDYAIEKFKQALRENPSASYAYASFTIEGKVMTGQVFSETKLREQNYIPTTALIRAEAFVAFDEALTRFQDWDLWLTMLEQGKRGVFVDDVLFNARVIRRGISLWRPRIWYSFWPIFGYAPQSYLDYEEAKLVIKQKHNLC